MLLKLLSNSTGGKKVGNVLTGIKKTIIRGKKSNELKPILSGDRIVVYEEKLANQLLNRSFGETKKRGLYLNIYEALLLAEEKKLDVYDKSGKKVPLKKLMEVGESLNEGFAMKYDVFRDLRLARGYVVKPGIKFGCDFVVYARGKKPGRTHSKWMVQVIPESARMDYSQLTGAARLATNVRKKLLLATVTERGPVYYEVGRAKL